MRLPTCSPSLLYSPQQCRTGVAWPLMRSACFELPAGDQMEWQWSGGFLVVVGPEINRRVLVQ